MDRLESKDTTPESFGFTAEMIGDLVKHNPRIAGSQNEPPKLLTVSSRRTISADFGVILTILDDFGVKSIPRRFCSFRTAFFFAEFRKF